MEHPAVYMFQEAVRNDNYAQAIRAVEYGKEEGIDTTRWATEKIPVWTDPADLAVSQEIVDLITTLKTSHM
jgi:hypothetical protein